MRILLFHTKYQWSGGEDAVVEAEAALLRSHGHEVVEHVADNKDILSRGRVATALGLWRGAWSKAGYDLARRLVAEHRPDIVHAHNFWYSLSPAVLAGAHDSGVPVVVTLHNFRLLCPGGVLLDKAGRPCEDCVGRSPWFGARRRCYHNSLLASAGVARMIAVNRKRGTWVRDVDLFLVPSEFCRKMFIRGGLPAEKIVVKPNFVEDPSALLTTETQRTQRTTTDSEPPISADERRFEGTVGGTCSSSSDPNKFDPKSQSSSSGEPPAPPAAPLPPSLAPYGGEGKGEGVSPSPTHPLSHSPRLRVIYVGRLSREKGLRTLLAAWPMVEKETGAELRIVGEGPLREELEGLAKGLNVSFAGRVAGDDLFREIAAAAVTVLPSECYETFGRVVVEGYACGRPVVVSNLGGPAELVRQGEGGASPPIAPTADVNAQHSTLNTQRSSVEPQHLGVERCMLNVERSATGLLFAPGDAGDLAEKLLRLLKDPELCARMGAAARAEYLARYTPGRNYEMLMGCYQWAKEKGGGQR